VKSNSEKAQRRLLLRQSMLLTIAQFAPTEIPISTVFTAVRIAGFQENEQEIAANLDYLSGWCVESAFSATRSIPMNLLAIFASLDSVSVALKDFLGNPRN
jgi:hypothetical protein